MKTFKSALVLILFLFGISGCNVESDFYENNSSSDIYLKNAVYANKATGSVEIIWKGVKKGDSMGTDMGGEKGNQPENLRAFFEFNAHESTDKTQAKGEVVFLVTTQDLTVHREIKATVVDVKIDPDLLKGWFVAQVLSDTKGCRGGGEPGSHESGCSGSGHTEGGCSGDTNHDEGCSHDTMDGGGCTNDHTDGSSCADGHANEGGCTNDHTDGSSCTDSNSDEGGCSGSDMGNEGGSGQGEPGGNDNGNPLSGKNCRIGQFILIKVHDLSTPGALNDGITWKWFAPETIFDLTTEPTKLCKKTIISGNIFVHI